MAKPKQSLTASNIKYLLVMKELSKDCSGVRSTDIAKKLEISKPSVHTMVKTLQRLKLIKKDRYSVIYFTEQGLQLASKYLHYFEAIRTYLNALLPENTDVKSAACALLAEIPEEDIEEMCSKLITESEDKKYVS